MAVGDGVGEDGESSATASERTPGHGFHGPCHGAHPRRRKPERQHRGSSMGCLPCSSRSRRATVHREATGLHLCRCARAHRGASCGTMSQTNPRCESAPVRSGEVMSEEQDHVPGAVVQISEIVGSSPNSFSDAVRNAVLAAAQSVRGITGVEVIRSNADVDENGNLSLYKVNCKIAFVVER